MKLGVNMIPLFKNIHSPTQKDEHYLRVYKAIKFFQHLSQVATRNYIILTIHVLKTFL